MKKKPLLPHPKMWIDSSDLRTIVFDDFGKIKIIKDKSQGIIIDVAEISLSQKK